MSDLAPDTRIAALIGTLAAEARPVRLLARPWLRTAYWLGAVSWIALMLSFFTDFGGMLARLGAAPDMWLSEAGAAATAVLAALAAFETSIPGRGRGWALLPLPAAALWIGASGMGCLRLTPLAFSVPEPRMHGMACLWFLLVMAVPLIAVLTILLVRACPLRPGLTAGLGGLACAAASAVLLSMAHPFDATAIDLTLHLVAIVVIVCVARLIGGRAMRQRADGGL